MPALSMSLAQFSSGTSQSSIVLGTGTMSKSYLFPLHDLTSNSLVSDETASLIRKLGELQPNWNGYGAKPIARQAIENALSFVVALTALGQNVPEPYVSPNENGTLALSWETKSGEAYLEFGTSLHSGYVTSNVKKDLFFSGDSGKVDEDFARAVQERLYAATDTRFLSRQYSLFGWIGDQTSTISFISIRR